MTSSNERTPLLQSRPSGLSASRPPAELTDDEVLAQESAFSAIRDASHGVDPNSSAFAPPDQSHFSINASGLAGVPETGEEPATETQRSDILVIMSSMWIGTALSAIDGTCVASILGTVGSEFKVSREIQWLGTSYLLTQTAFQPLYGRFSDIFGRKTATLFASFTFGLGCLLCGLSQSFWQLCAARALAGIGGGGLTTMSTIVTSDLVSLKSRGTWQGLGNLVYAAGASGGAPLAGLLVDAGLGWRTAFLVQVPLCMVHFGVVTWKVNIPGGPGSVVEKLKRIDVFGAITLVGSVGLIIVSLSLGGNTHAWNSTVVLSSLIGGLILLVAFVLVEKYVAREPLMPMAVLFRRTPGFVALACWFITMSQFGIIFNIPLYFSSVEQTSSSYAGLHLIPNAIVASACSLSSGLIMARVGRYKGMLLTFGSLAFVGPLFMCFWQRGHTPEWAYWLTMPWNGAAYGGILTITLVALIASIEPTMMAAATGVTYLFRATGSVLGISLSNAVLQNQLQKNLEKSGLTQKIISAIRRDVNVIKKLSPHNKVLAVTAMETSFHQVFIAITAAAFCAFLCLLPIQEFALPGSEEAKEQQRRREATIEEEDEE
ncbi:hypothetical protein FA10DRAFT_43433 [Acaromyces ingoldii]|uniref:Major facilitator superfamily (MFS) profile domain-containing protein n=1 Tax=Acaromyces ingoldii TaxID=215250 RepID=A0A316Z207_9BASI|nr:hypothetical protein FA10DRAFT_43433 [Acaromyces ingoldii]PWN94213.1 hypothetical protein FA10DRAFT_43433 [Acaromyces ingoldii]